MRITLFTVYIARLRKRDIRAHYILKTRMLREMTGKSKERTRAKRVLKKR